MACASTQAGLRAHEHPCSSGKDCSLTHSQGDVSSGQTGFTSVFGEVFEHWGKASAFHSPQLASTVNSVLVFPCTVCIVVFINRIRKKHLSLPRSSLTFEL